MICIDEQWQMPVEMTTTSMFHDNVLEQKKVLAIKYWKWFNFLKCNSQFDIRSKHQQMETKWL